MGFCAAHTTTRLMQSYAPRTNQDGAIPNWMNNNESLTVQMQRFGNHSLKQITFCQLFVWRLNILSISLKCIQELAFRTLSIIISYKYRYDTTFYSCDDKKLLYCVKCHFAERIFGIWKRIFKWPAVWRASPPAAVAAFHSFAVYLCWTKLDWA